MARRKTTAAMEKTEECPHECYESRDRRGRKVRAVECPDCGGTARSETPCDDCDGEGCIGDDANSEPCEECDGEGYAECENEDCHRGEVPCPRCEQDGE